MCSPPPAGGVHVMMRTYDLKPSQDRLTRSGGAAGYTDQASVHLTAHLLPPTRTTAQTHSSRLSSIDAPWVRTCIWPACACHRSPRPLHTRCSCARLACCPASVCHAFAVRLSIPKASISYAHIFSPMRSLHAVLWDCHSTSRAFNHDLKSYDKIFS